MRKSLKLGVIVMTIVLVGSSVVALAAEPAKGQAGPEHSVSRNLPPTVIFNRRLVSTSQSWECCGIVGIAAGFVALDAPLKFTCPAGGTCTVSAEQNVQVRGTTSANKWAICTQVDGAFIAEPNCPYLGVIPSDSSFLAGSFTQNVSAVAPGNHTLQTFVYTDNGGDRAVYNITYRLYRP
jgi:hypothetical protein